MTAPGWVIEPGRDATRRLRSQWQLLGYALRQWPGLLLLILGEVISVAFSLLTPWPLKLLIDRIQNHHATSRGLQHFVNGLPGPNGADGLLMWMAIGTVVLFVGATLVQMAVNVLSVDVGQRMTYDLGGDLFEHLQRLSLLYHHREPAGDRIARVTGDAYCVQTLVIAVLLPAGQALFMLVSMFVLMWHIQPQLSLLSLVVIPFLLYTIRRFGPPMKERSRSRRDVEVQMMSVVEQTLTAMPAVQAFGREEREAARFREIAGETVSAYRRAAVTQSWFKLFVGLATAVGTAGLIWLGGHMALEGTITAGTIFLFVTYVGLLYGPINSLSYMASTLQANAANADRVLEVLRMPALVEERPDALEVSIRGEVRYERVGFGYEPGQPALREVTLAVEPGEVVAVVGPTGAGKSTLMSLLVRFFDPDTGRISIDGHDIRAFRLRSLRDQIAIVLQDPFIFPTSVSENIAYGRPDATVEEIREAARAANAEEFVLGMPNGYDTIVGERGATLSGGEKQRLSIARAFLKNAPILILDEPTSALDARTESMLLEAIDQLMRGRTTFIIAHRLSTIRNADHVVVMDHGAIVEQGRHADLLRRDGLYASLVRHQGRVGGETVIDLRTGESSAVH